MPAVTQLSPTILKMLFSLMLQARIHEHADEFLDMMASDDAIFHFCGMCQLSPTV
jgi:hypothetical protein